MPPELKDSYKLTVYMLGGSIMSVLAEKEYLEEKCWELQQRSEERWVCIEGWKATPLVLTTALFIMRHLVVGIELEECPCIVWRRDG